MTDDPGPVIHGNERTPPTRTEDAGEAQRGAERAALVKLVREPHEHVHNTPTTAYAEAVADAVLAAGYVRVPERVAVDAADFMLSPGVYELTKRLEVDENGIGRWIDMPDGIYVGGFWHKTRSAVVRVSGPDRGSVSGGGKCNRRELTA